MASRTAVVALLGLALLGFAAASEFTSEHVVHLTTSNFEEKVRVHPSLAGQAALRAGVSTQIIK